MSTTLSPELSTEGIAAIPAPGYIRHWLVTALHETPYTGPAGEERDLRRDAVDQSAGEAPAGAAPGQPGPLGEPWQYRHTGNNYFVEHTSFFHRLTLVESHAFTLLDVAEEGGREATLWVSGVADFWINGSYLARLDGSRYMFPEFKRVTLPLRRGANTISVRLQCFCTRDTRILFGIQLADTTGVQVRLPGTAALMGASDWLQGVRADGHSMLAARRGAPSDAEIRADGDVFRWSAGAEHLCFGNARPALIALKMQIDGHTLERTLEIPANYPRPSQQPDADLRTIYLERSVAGYDLTPDLLKRKDSYLPLLARRLLGQISEKDTIALHVAVTLINNREDCADFALAALLRLVALNLATQEEAALIKQTALAFRYWRDEPGNDAMCFWSENHSLLFHGCQMIAGGLYPNEIFQCSGRIGRDHAALGARRCTEWLDHVEPRGFVEFNSSAYMPITIGALLNLVDFAADDSISSRASALIDRIYGDLASHSFQGIIITPQGRVYRNVLYPERSGNQALVSFATGDVTAALPANAENPSLGTSDWLVFLASSKKYTPPANLAARSKENVSRRYAHAGVEIVVEKTQDWILTSLAIPAQEIPEKEQNWELTVGRGGYQQHVWQATLAADCHVFVSHPGSSMDMDKARPGYWYGNGLIPCVRQHGRVLMAIHNIPDGSGPHPQHAFEQWSWPISTPVPFDLHPIPFTHAHWPSDAFDQQTSKDGWIFGRKNNGFIGLWCSETLQPHDDVLTARELRAYAHRCAWVTVCGSAAENGTFEAFMDLCIAKEPRFDKTALTLSTAGEGQLTWTRRV